jgi:hypothetical protein
MELKGIISISGKSGLFKVIGQGKNNVIVQSLEDGKKFPAFSSNKISSLEDITIYCSDEDTPLVEVYTKMFAHLKGAAAIDHKGDVAEMRKVVAAFLPNYDAERVGNGDVKKLFQWYNILHKADLLKETEIKEEKEGETPAEKEGEAKVAKAKPAAKKKVVATPTANKTTKAAPVKKVNAPRKTV